MKAIFQINDIVDENERYFNEGKGYFGKHLKRIKKAKVKKVIAEMSVENPFMYVLQCGKEERCVNQIFLQRHLA